MKLISILVSLWRSTIWIALGLTISTAAWADTGGLRISITDTKDSPISGAEIKVSSPDSLVSKAAKTDANGAARLLGLDPATNYTVQVSAKGFPPLTQDDVAVVSGRDISLTYVLGSDATQLDSIVVTGRSLAALDTTSATVGTTITLDLTESLPTQRSYQDYLQLVPGVKPSSGGNPGSKSGVNYSDIGGAYGTSTDNIYYIDGVNVTDSNTGTFGSNLNSEIIQELDVLTGGVPAEFDGGSGLVARVVTKSGGDEFHGSVNYYFQNDSLVASNQNLPSNGFSKYDAAVTLGGPIVKQKLWFFASYQKKSNEDDVSDANTGALLRTVETDSDLFFGKLTWQATDADRLQFTFFNDPFERSGSTSSTIVANRDRARKQGGDNFKLEYSRDWNFLRLSAYAFKHEGEVSNVAADGSTRNDVAFLTGSPQLADLQQGGYGQSIESFRDREEYGISLEYLLFTGFGEHRLKAGYSFSDNEYNENAVYTGPDRAIYRSIAAADSGATFDDYVGPGWTGTRSLTSDDANRIITAADASADRDAYLAELDTNNDGSISPDEVGALVFDSSLGNPNDQINAYRIVQSITAPYTVTTEGQTLYIQDSWTYNRFTVNAGLRSERWKHKASDGTTLFAFDWEIAPRLSVIYDISGDGRSKVWAFGGRYYDPVRTNITDFAGNLTGSVYDEQVFVGDRWLTFRTRGGPSVPDAVFAPSTKTPYTDELLLGYATTIGTDLSLSITYTRRKTEDILEDYDLHVYSDPTLGPADGGTAGTDFFLPYSYFGYSDAPNSNYVIATLAGGKREYSGIEVALRKLRSNNWQGLASYTYNDAKGNTNSDSNADLQGDILYLDPRAPNVFGDQPGNIRHQLKLAGSYFWNWGLEVGGVMNFNSGVLYSRTTSLYGRNAPVQVEDAYEYGGVTDNWVADGAVGTQNGPAFVTIDLRAKYTLDLPVGQAELFVDIFNLLNDQSATKEQDLVAGDGAYGFGEAIDWVAPRSFYLGARYSF